MNLSRLIASCSFSPAPRRAPGAPAGFALLKPGLNLKILLIVVSVSLIGVLASSFLVLTLQRQQLIDSSLTATTHLSNTIKVGLGHAMLSNDRATASQIVQSMVGEGGVQRMRILDAQGVVQISSIPLENGVKFDRSQPTCQFCHSGGAESSHQTTMITQEDGRDALLNVNLIRNESQCAACHASQNEILGALMVEMPMTELDNQLAAGLSRMALSAVATLGLLVLLMVFALGRLVARPIRRIRRKAAGDRTPDVAYRIRTRAVLTSGLPKSRPAIRNEKRRRVDRMRPRRRRFSFHPTRVCER